MNRTHPHHGGRHRRAHLPGPRGRRASCAPRLGRGLDGRARRHGRALVPPHGYRWRGSARGARGKGLRAEAAAAVRICSSRSGRARAHIRRIRPDVVLGLGGYVAFPGGMMASLSAGRSCCTSRTPSPASPTACSAGVADRVMVGLPARRCSEAREWIGNPVRAEIAAIAAAGAALRGRSGPLRLLVVGGSLGAQALNEVAAARARAARRAAPAGRAPGGREASRRAAARHYAAAGVQGELVPFIDDMARALCRGRPASSAAPAR